MRVVHAADIHLDTPYRRQDAALRERLENAGHQALSALVDLSIEVDADALLIAGDLFDNERLTIATEVLLVDEFQRLTEAGVTVVYATGNHDPGRANYRASKISWPAAGFHFHSSRRPARIPILRRGERVGWVVTAGHLTSRESVNLAKSFPPAPGPEPAIAMLHANIRGVHGAPEDEAGGGYAPAARSDLVSSYAYWALGHIHRRQEVCEEPPAHYPGNIQGRDFGETGAKGALVVELNPPEEPRIDFRPLAGVRWETLTLSDLGDARSITDLQSVVREQFVELRETDEHILADQEWILRVELTGPCRPELIGLLRDEAERDELGRYLADTLPVLDVDVRDTGLYRPTNLLEHRRQRHVLGVALELIDRARRDEEVLARLTPQILAQLDRYPDDCERKKYLLDLLNGLDAKAAEALLREDTA